MAPHWGNYYHKAMIPNYINDLANLLKPKGELRIVGGAVRNMILGRKISDYDCAINCPPEDILPLLKPYKCNINGMKFGVLGVHFQHHYIELASTREDIATDGRRAVIKYTSDWQKDALRRDFTINALYLDMNGFIHDYCGGLYDFNPLILQFIGSPAERIKEDTLRYLRFYRFIAQFNVQRAVMPENITIESERWLNLSPERIENEIKLLLHGQNWLQACKKAQEDGVFLLCGMIMDNKNFVKYQYEFSYIKTSLLIKSLLFFPSWVPVSWGKQFMGQQKCLLDNMKNENYYQLYDIFSNELFYDLLFFQYFHGFISNNKYISLIDEFKQYPKNKFPLTGHDLPFQGKLLGEKLQYARQLWYNSGYAMKKQALIKNTINSEPNPQE